jgi:hypothetical protein
MQSVCKVFCLFSGPYDKGAIICRSVNEPLNVTCTLSQDALSKGFTSSGLEFKAYQVDNVDFKQRVLTLANETTQRVVNDTTVELHFPRVPSYFNRFHLDCQYDQSVAEHVRPENTHTYLLLIGGEYMPFFRLK